MASALLANEVNYMRCFLCENFLSIPPIMTLSADGLKNQCGRCKAIEYKGSTRNICFENLAKHLSFPCIYKNCQESILWSEVEEHEKVCMYKTIQCPIYYQNDCHEVVEITHLESHLKRKHSHNIFYGKVLNRQIAMLASTVNFVKTDDEIFIVNINQDCIFVCSLGPVRKFNKFNVQICSSECKDKLVVFQNQDVIEYDERLHCYKCQREVCTLKHHLFSLCNSSTPHRYAVVTDRNLLSAFLLNPKSILISLTLVCETVNDSMDLTLSHKAIVKEQAFEHNSSVICRSLECIVCIEYMVDEVYSCESGHLVCYRCKLRLKYCPLCKVRLGNTRCLLAETFSRDVELACQSEGCDFTGKLGKLALHERSCIRCMD